jgi:midasin (ATPase involved in ribosome maturation)
MNRRVYMADENIVFATANIGAAFAGTFGQDRAFRERFAITIERDFPPLAEEVKILTSATGIAEAYAKKLSVIAESSRRMWKAQTIEQPISTRTLVTWALLVAGGYTIMQAAEYTVLPMYSEDGGVDSDRSKVRLEIQGKGA